MDLLQSVRKEGSRGGVDFKWEDVKGSNHRENYLGHSLMAPVGRWQKNKDLNWYAKGEDTSQTEEDEVQRRKEELRKVKEAEEDAMARALGLPLPDRSANQEPLGVRALGDDESASLTNTSKDETARTSKSADHRIKEDSRRTKDRHRRHHKHHSRRRSHGRERNRSRSWSPKRHSNGPLGRSQDYDSLSRSRSRSRRRSRSIDRYYKRQSSHEPRRHDRSRKDNRYRSSRRERHYSRSRSPHHTSDRDRRAYNDR